MGKEEFNPKNFPKNFLGGDENLKGLPTNTSKISITEYEDVSDKELKKIIAYRASIRGIKRRVGDMKIKEIINGGPNGVIVHFATEIDQANISFSVKVLDGEEGNKSYSKKLNSDKRHFFFSNVELKDPTTGETEVYDYKDELTVLISVQVKEDGDIVAYDEEEIDIERFRNIGRYNGEDSYDIISDGFDDDVYRFYKKLLRDGYKYMKKHIGRDALPTKVTFVSHPEDFVFFPSANRVRMKKIIRNNKAVPHVKNLFHEWIHAIYRMLLISSDKKRDYSNTNEIWVEAIAQAGRNYVLNKFVEDNPRYYRKNGKDWLSDSYLFGSSMGWDYDYRNVPYLSNHNVQSNEGNGSTWEKYEVGAAAIRKIQLEYNHRNKRKEFYVEFHRKYFGLFRKDLNYVPDIEDIFDIIEDLTNNEIEGQTVDEWLQNNHILCPKIEEGNHIWVNYNHGFKNQDWGGEYISENDIYFLPRNKNGGEDNNFNGEKGTVSIYSNWNNRRIYRENVQITPKEDRENGNRIYGKVRLFISNADKENGQATFLDEYEEHFQDTIDNGGLTRKINPVFIQESGLYRIEVKFGSTNHTFYRVLGEAMLHLVSNESSNKFVVGFANHSDRERQGRETIHMVRLAHEETGTERTDYHLINGIIATNTQFIGIPNPKTEGTDSIPGQLKIQVYTKDTANPYQLKKTNHYRNIDFGNKRGGQLLLIE